MELVKSHRPGSAEPTIQQHAYIEVDRGAYGAYLDPEVRCNVLQNRPARRGIVGAFKVKRERSRCAVPRSLLLAAHSLSWLALPANGGPSLW